MPSDGNRSRGRQRRAPRAPPVQSSRAPSTVNSRTSVVNMPSGEKTSLTIPAKTCNCATTGANLQLVTLNPNGAVGAREYNIVKDEMYKTLQSYYRIGFTIVKIEKIMNCCLWTKFREREKEIAKGAGFVNEQMLFHGTPAAATLAKTGLDFQRAIDGQFGRGLYFYKNSTMANQFVFGDNIENGCHKHKDMNCHRCKRTILLCRVCLGKAQQMNKLKNVTNLDPGCHSVEAVVSPTGFKHKEYVVHRGDQVYPEFLITFKTTDSTRHRRERDREDNGED